MLHYINNYKKTKVELSMLSFILETNKKHLQALD